MLHIVTEVDLANIQTKVSSAVYTTIHQQFQELKDASYDPEVHEVFTLDSGHIVFIEESDTAEDMEMLLTSWPEYSQLLRNEDGTELWKVVCLLDNDFIMTYLAPKGVHSEVDELAERYLESE